MSRFRRYFLGAAVPAFLAGMLSVSCAESRGGNSLPAHVTGKTDSLALHYGEDVREDWLGVGLWGIPLPYDWNSDGVKDLLVSCPDTPYKGLYLFINKGTSSRPFFSKAVRLSHVGRNNIRLSEAAGIPHVLSAGKEYPDFFAAPYASGLKINYEGEKLGKDYRKSRSNMWNYADWNGDGDMDIVVGIDTWDDYGWDNAYDADGVWQNGPLHGYVYLLENRGGKYWSLVSAVSEKYRGMAHEGIYSSGIHCGLIRNRLVLISSEDVYHWKEEAVIIESDNPFFDGFQYVDWQFDGDDLISVIRLAMEEERGLPQRQHDANFLVFLRIPDFRTGNYSTIHIDTFSN